MAAGTIKKKNEKVKPWNSKHLPFDSIMFTCTTIALHSVLMPSFPPLFECQKSNS